MVFDRLLPRRSTKRLAVYVDGPNVIREEFDLDFDALRERLEARGRIVTGKVFLNQYAPEKLVEAVASQGFEPVVGVGEEEGEASDVDVYLAVSAMDAVYDDRVDTLVLVTRDADFLPLVQQAKAHGKEVVVAGHPEGFSTALQHAADDVMEL